MRDREKELRRIRERREIRIYTEREGIARGEEGGWYSERERGYSESEGYAREGIGRGRERAGGI